MSRADGVLRVVLTGKWFDMIESGEKMEEYRGILWGERLVDFSPLGEPFRRSPEWWDINGRSLMDDMMELYDQVPFLPYHTLVASRGYTSRTLTRKIKRIRWGTPRPEWSGDTVTGNCFIIELEAPE